MDDSRKSYIESSLLNDFKSLNNQINSVKINITEYYNMIRSENLKYTEKPYVLLRLYVIEVDLVELEAIYQKIFTDNLYISYPSLESTLIVIINFTQIYFHHYSNLLNQLVKNDNYVLTDLLKDSSTDEYFGYMKENLTNITEIEWEN
jgi:hypothetical protein